MEAGSFKLKIVSPLGQVAEEEVTRATFPTANGEVTVLADHRKYMVVLGVGVLEFDLAGTKEVVRLVVRRGVGYFADNTLAIVADAIYQPDAANSAELLAQKGELKTFLESADSGSEEYTLASDQLAAIEAVEKLVAAPGH